MKKTTRLYLIGLLSGVGITLFIVGIIEVNKQKSETLTVVIPNSTKSVETKPINPDQEPIKFFINYKKTIEKINTIGHYTVSKHISSKFFKKEKSSGKDTVNGIIVKFKSEFVTSKEAISWMNDNKLRPATLKELQMFGINANTPDNIYTVALGSVVKTDGTLNVPMLWGGKWRFIEEFLFADGVWNSHYYHFLAIDDSCPTI